MINSSKKKFFRNIFGSVSIKVISMLLNMMMLPIYINYFKNKSILGVWFVIITIFNTVIIFDFGLGNGLRNFLTELIENNENKQAKKLLSTTYGLMIIISLILLIILIFVNIKIEWNIFFKISTNDISEKVLKKIMGILFIGSCLNIILKIITSVLLSLEKIILANTLPLVSNIFIIIIIKKLSIISLNEENKLLALALGYIVSVNLILLLVSIYIFTFDLKKIKPSFGQFDLKKIKPLLQIGMFFFLIQGSLLILNTSNEFFINKFFTAKAVVNYQIYNRIFNIFIAFFSVSLSPIWSIVTKCYIKKEINKIENIYKYLIYFSLIIFIALIILMPFFQGLINLWLKDNTIKIKYSILIKFICFSIVQLLNLSISCISNGINAVKLQSYCNFTAALFKIPMIYLGIKIIKSWDLIILINIVIILPGLIFQHNKIKKKLKNIKGDIINV